MAPNNKKTLYCNKEWHLKIFRMSFNSKGQEKEFSMQDLTNAILAYIFDEHHPERLQVILETL